MRIPPEITVQATRAYGLALAGSPPAASPATPPRPTPLVPTAGEPRGEQHAQRLIGGRVPGSADPGAAATPTAPGGEIFQLYTRAADKIEAAVAVQLGRSIDVTG